MGNDELKHYGVLGMHWGIRRYQPYPGDSKLKFGRQGKEVGEATKVVQRDDASKAKNHIELARIRSEERKSKDANRTARYVAKKNYKAERIRAKNAEKLKENEEEKNRGTKTDTKSKVKNMTDQELNNAINRLNNEKRYKDLVKDLNEPGIAKVLKKSLSSAGTDASNKIIQYYVGTALNKLMGTNITNTGKQLSSNSLKLIDKFKENPASLTDQQRKSLADALNQKNNIENRLSGNKEPASVDEQQNETIQQLRDELEELKKRQ